MSGDLDLRTVSVPIYTVDAFTNKRFSGNPAAVCLLSPGQVLSDETQQKIGAEMNISETAFVSLEDGDFAKANKFGLRWFTPTSEVDLCGHATLSSAAVLFFEKGNSNEEIHFATRSGQLSVSRLKDNPNRLSLNFPLNPPSPKDPESVKKLLEVSVGDHSLIQDVQLSKTGKLVVRLKDSVTRETLEKLQPQIERMIESEPSKVVKGIGITLKGSRENGCVDSNGEVYDFVSRYFAPWFGIPEDPVTGSWHTVAGDYWAKQLNKTTLYARQCSARGGDIWITVKGERVIISGDAIINLRGTFSL